MGIEAACAAASFVKHHMSGVVSMDFCTAGSIPRTKLAEFFRRRWGSTKMVIASGIYECTELAGFGVLDEEGEIVGLITYVLRGDECEVTSLDSLRERQGLGTALLEKVEQVALENGCRVLRLTTTNDNLPALRFYQKRGFVLHRLLPGAVERSREIKPEIPLLGVDGIPIRDEIELVKILK